jgi:hypothetical protein
MFLKRLGCVQAGNPPARNPNLLFGGVFETARLSDFKKALLRK